MKSKSTGWPSSAFFAGVRSQIRLNDTKDEGGNKLFPDIFLPFEENPRIIGVVKEHFFPVQIR